MITFVTKNPPKQVEFSELDPTAIFIEPNSARNFYFMSCAHNNIKKNGIFKNN